MPSSTATIDAINRRIYRRHRWLASSTFYTEIRPGKRQRGLPLSWPGANLRRCEVSDPPPPPFHESWRIAFIEHALPPREILLSAYATLHRAQIAGSPFRIIRDPFVAVEVPFSRFVITVILALHRFDYDFKFLSTDIWSATRDGLKMIFSETRNGYKSDDFRPKIEGSSRLHRILRKESSLYILLPLLLFLFFLFQVAV